MGKVLMEVMLTKEERGCIRSHSLTAAGFEGTTTGRSSNS
jgi:hypothetical protein